MVLASLAMFALLGPVRARAEWDYVRAGSDARGALTLAMRSGELYVSARQFCYAFGCRVIYQWANHRAVIQNPDKRLAAILSPLTGIALIDGRILDFEGQILSELREGYLLSIDLAQKLAPELRLGRLIYKKNEKPSVSLANAENRQLKRIIIDPGHGGNDFGTNSGGIYEKDVAIIYAMKLKEELHKELPDLEVLLTRADDRYVSLPDRANFANSKNANLFLSLHVNHAGDSKIEGAESYILSPEATDDEAKRLALLENDTWLKTANIKEAGDNVRKILVDMEQTKYIQDSALAAAMIQQEVKALDKGFGLKNRGVKQAMFYVLSQVAMPSTLVEMAFLSSTGDRGRLMDVAFRDQFVKSLVNALKRYREKMQFKKEIE